VKPILKEVTDEGNKEGVGEAGTVLRLAIAASAFCDTFSGCFVSFVSSILIGAEFATLSAAFSEISFFSVF